jgi:hypothetical protein
MFTINSLFELVDYDFRCLKSAMNQCRCEADWSDLAVLSLIMFTAPVNLSIKQARYTEESLRIDCPQFKTFYHVLAVLIVKDLISGLNGEMDQIMLASNP